MVDAPTPKDRFTSLDTLALVREIRGLGPARVDKAFDLPAPGWSIALRSPRLGRRELVLVPGRYAALLEARADRTEELSPFARELRRLLAGAALRAVVDPMGERYVELIFERMSETGEIVLAAELFGSGNVVVARGGVLAAVARPRRWAHRDVRVGRPYARPPARPDPWTLGAGEIERALAQSRTDLASTLAARLGLGGPVAEEILARTALPGAEPSAPLAASAAPTVRSALAELVAEIGESPRGFLVERGGELVEAAPYRPRRWPEERGFAVRELPTFSEAAFRYFPSVAPPVEDADAAAARALLKELERLAERQSEAIRTLSSAAEERKLDADAVFAHYAAAEVALRAAAELDPVPARVAVRLGARTAELPFARTPRESAQALYEEAKRLAEKLEGATSALEATRQRLAAPPAPPARTKLSAASREARHPWFERFRWFVSSEGVLVLGGRDASSNDLLVRRHLKAGDLYVHADLHGAASVIVKAMPDRAAPGEATIQEAAQWAVAFSKAWRAGLASGSAFWTTPDQVSKAGGSGEFVAKGAWVVRGTKHVLKDLPLELAIGTVDYGGEERWTVAPPSALEARGRLRARLVPGEERDRSRVEVDLARDLGVSRTVLQGLLPAGGLTVRHP
jgi:predicted ribosome quality control (RQC) complex YloA/Tae2 family protein